MSKIVLIHPPMSLTDLYGDLAEAGSELAPQGLCSLAAVAREHGYTSVIIDSEAVGLNVEGTLQEALRHLPQYVGISTYTISVDVVAEIAARLKRENPDLLVIVGGAHVSAIPGDTMKKYPQFDIGVIGEGEVTLLELLRTLDSSGDLGTVKGIVFRKKGEIVKTGRRPFIDDLDSLPLPAWDLLPRLDKHYIPAGDSIKRLPSAGIVTSRGCPGRCYFCNAGVFGRRTRDNSAEYVVRMIKDLIERYGIKDIYIQDDTFVVNREKVMEFCHRLIDEEPDITWSCHARTDLVDPEMLALMKKSGCWQIGFGMESGSQKVLDSISKGTTVEQNERALQWCKDVGLAVKGLFMMGSFGETKETIRETFDFIRHAYMTDFHMTFFTPFPATVAYKIWDRHGKFDPSQPPLLTLEPSFVPNGLTREELIRYQKEAYRAFYLRPRIILYFLPKLLKPRQTIKIVKSAMALLNYAFSGLRSRKGASNR